MKKFFYTLAILLTLESQANESISCSIKVGLSETTFSKVMPERNFEMIVKRFEGLEFVFRIMQRGPRTEHLDGNPTLIGLEIVQPVIDGSGNKRISNINFLYPVLDLTLSNLNIPGKSIVVICDNESQI